MRPSRFFEEVVTPNLQAMNDRPGDVRLVINAILTIDALVGLLHVSLRDVDHPDTAGLPDDEDYRERLAVRCPGYAAVRDTAASLKHGVLTRQGKKRIPRVIRSPDSLQTMPAALGLLEVGDEIHGHVAMLCLVDGTDAVRADEALAATVRELRPLLRELSDPEPGVPA